VLFYLEGMPYPEVAEELGCPKGTVSSRLTAAKGMLRKRLVRRGVMLSAALLGAVLAKTASASVTVGLTISTVQTMRLIAGGPAAGAGAVSARAMTLAEGVMKTMLMTKVKLVAALLVAAGVFGFGTTLIVQHAVQAQVPQFPDRPSLKPPVAEPPSAEPAAKPAPVDRADPASPAPKADPPPVLRPPDLSDPRKAPPVVDPTTKPVPPIDVRVAPPVTTPAPAKDALAERLARIEDRLARLEAELAKLQGRPETTKPKPDYFEPKTDSRDRKDVPRYGTPPYGPAPGLVDQPKRPTVRGQVNDPNAENIPVVDAAEFKLPVDVDETSRAKIAEIALYCSDDQGATWRQATAIGPKGEAFRFRAGHDGLWWFKVQVVHTDKTLSPPDINNKTAPDVKVWVQTKPTKENKEALLEDLELQLKAIQKRIAELKATGPDPAPSPSKP
jgi:Sigma-70, region 4